MVQMVADTSLYDLLGVAPDAADDVIKKAYRKKAMQHHPDKNPNDPQAAEKFQDMANAYDVLSDPQMRSIYDSGGLDALASNMNADMNMNTDDLFETLFGGGFGGGAGLNFGFDMGGGGTGGKPRKGEDTLVHLDVTLEDLYNGKTIKTTMEKEVVCAVCSGSGAKANHKPKKCARCDGKGFTYAHNQTGRSKVGVQQVICPDCEGAGMRLKEKDRCKKCKGDGTTKEKKRQEIVIEKGMSERDRIILAAEGDQQPGIPPGDVVFALRVAPHAAFTRSGNDLRATVRLTLSEALLGFSRVVLMHLDARGISLARPRGRIVRPGDAVVVRGEGMPARVLPGAPPTRGDLFLVFEIEMPPDDWLARVDTTALERMLPPRKPGMVPRPSVVDDVRYEPTDIAAFGEGDEEGWVDEEDADEDGLGQPPECRTQ